MKRYIALWLAVMLIFGALPAVSSAEPGAASASGIMVSSNGNADFPSAQNLSAKALRREIDEITRYAAEAGFGSILFEVRSAGDALYRSPEFPTSQFLLKKQGAFTFFDPLGEMIKSAKKQGLSVYAVVDPYSLGKSLETLSPKSPAIRDESLVEQHDGGYRLSPFNAQVMRLNAADIKAMSKRYDLAGILFENIAVGEKAPDSAMLLLNSVKKAVNGKTKLGVILPDSALEDDFSAALGLCDIVMPQIAARATPEKTGYAARVKAWQNASAAVVAPMIPVGSSSLSATQLTAQAFSAEINGCAFWAVNGYGDLIENSGFKGDMLASMNFKSSAAPEPLPYQPTQSLTITRPLDTITVNSPTYFIMGTSDPSLSLMLGWKTVERVTSDGVFGVLVNLGWGKNTFTLRQGNTSKTVTIVRSAGGGGAATTTKITSAAPKSSLLAYNGESFSVTCVAPAGKTVTASLGGKTVTLKQNAAASANIPATFSGSFIFNGANDGEMLDLGPVSYSISGGESAESVGSVYLLGSGTDAYIEVSDSAASVFPDSSVAEGKYKSVYKRGVIEKIDEQAGEYYKLSSGGYIKKAAVNVINFTQAGSRILTAVSEEHDENAERFVLKGLGGVPYTFSDGDGVCELTLHGITSKAEAASLPQQSELFSSIAWKPLGDDLVCIMRMADPKKVWGIDVLNDGEDAVLYVNRAPALSDKIGRPLSNVTVVLDPGHGGTDIGAPSVLGVNGINERDVNLANALMLKMRLEQLGATVTLTREDNDTTLSLYERMDIAQSVLPDFFISMHHNSVAEATDANEHSGVEAYYYSPFGASLAETAVKKISQNVFERDYRFSEWSYYTVTRIRFSPSILCEIGFVPNPLEFSHICDETEIYKTANSIAEAMLGLVAAAR